MISEPTRVCTKCSLSKPLSEFAKAAYYRDGYRPECRHCTNSATRYIRSVYRSGEYSRRVAEQAGCCAACHRPAKLVVDHKAGTECVRGLLCDPCNKALGHAQDDQTVLRGLLHYLSLHDYAH